MRPLKPLLLVIGAAAVTAENDSACSSVSTIFVTVSASPTTETVHALSKLSASNDSIEELANGAARVTPTAITRTVPASVVRTHVISVVQASLQAEDQAAYSFTEDNGTTTWLGATPPASAFLVTSTQVVTLQPVPVGFVPPRGEVDPISSYLTHSSTQTVTETHTETRTLPFSTAFASAGAYTGLASNGWNSSMATFITVQSPHPESITIEEKAALYSGTAYPRVPSKAVPFSSGKIKRRVEARSIPDIVVATIDGMVVSWTNNFDGTPLSTSDTSTNVIPTTATVPQSVESEYSRKIPKLQTGRRLRSLLAAPSNISSPVQTGVAEGPLPSVSAAGGSLSLASISSSSTIQLTSHDLLSLPNSYTSTASSTAATATTSSCGDVSADFVIDFDDLPVFSGDTDIPPIFNPYHHLFFEKYFGYVPPPSDPFPPISPPQLAVYRAGGSESSTSPGAGDEMTGEIGAGPRASDSAYWIDAYSAYLGCNNPGPGDCDIMVKGYQIFSAFSYITQGFTLPPCLKLENCSLALLEFADGFRNLTGLQIIATVGTTPVDWYMDNLSLGWSNNTCAAQLERSSQE